MNRLIKITYLFSIMLIITGTTAIAGESTAMLLQNSFTNVAEKAFESVVVITNKQVIQQQAMYPNLPPELQYFFGIPQQRQQEKKGSSIPQPAGSGSGVIISDNGYILTNYHVIKDADALAVKLKNGDTYDAVKDKNQVKIIGVDEETDLAVIQIGDGKLKDLPTLDFADSDNLKVGQWAIAVGAPFQFDYTVTVGVVSQKGRYDMGMTTYENYIQTDASINPGNSGGPLLDLNGDIIGINNFIVTGGGMSKGSVGIGFAIASNLAQQVSTSLIEDGEVIRPFLGISMQPMNSQLREQFGVKYGVLVNEVIKGDPAENAGVEAGDVILKVGNKVVRSPHDLQFAVLAYKPGEKIKLTINRKGDIIEKSVRARRKDGKAIKSKNGQEEESDKMGIYLQENEKGVYVANIANGSPAEISGLIRGDQILEVNRIEISTIKEFKKALSESHNNTAILYIARKNSKFYLAIPLGKE